MSGLTKKATIRGVVYFVDCEGITTRIVCSICRVEKDASSFYKNKSSIYGYRGDCKVCVGISTRRYREENPDVARNYRERNRKEIADKQVEWTSRNPGYSKAYYLQNRENELRRGKLWAEENPSNRRLSNLKRRARISSLPDDFTLLEKDATYSFFGGCALTGKTEDIHWDHVIPLSIGHGGTTASNMIPLVSSVNISKSVSNIFEWYEENGARLGLMPELFAKAIEYLAELNSMSTQEYREYVYECHANPNDNSTEAI